MAKKIKKLMIFTSVITILYLGFLSNLVFIGSLLGICIGIYIGIEVPKFAFVKKILSFIQAIKTVMNDDKKNEAETQANAAEKEVESSNADTETSNCDTVALRHTKGKSSTKQTLDTDVEKKAEKVEFSSETISATTADAEIPQWYETSVKEEAFTDATQEKNIFFSPEQALNYVLQGK